MNLRSLAALSLLACLPSCTSVGIADQPVLGRAAMKISDQGAYAADCSLVSQVEKGRALSNSTSGGGCASCH